MEGSTTNSRVTSQEEPPIDKRRKYWSRAEEDALVIAVKEKVVDGWRSGNGWRPGFYKRVALRIRQLVPGSDVRHDPHVVSKLSAWKKDHNNLVILFGASGQGLDTTDYSIPIVGSDIWNASVRVNPDIEKMRGKSYPYFDDWKEMFGKDWANGSTAQDFGSTLDQIQNNERNAQSEVPPPGVEIPFTPDELTAENEEISSSSMPPPGSKKHKNRRNDMEESMVAMMGSYMTETKEAIADLSKAISALNEVDPAVPRVFGELENIPGFTMEMRIVATRKIASSRTDVAIFFSLGEEAKRTFVHNILQG